MHTSLQLVEDTREKLQGHSLGSSELSLSFNLIEHARKRCVHTVAIGGRARNCAWEM